MHLHTDKDIHTQRNIRIDRDTCKAHKHASKDTYTKTHIDKNTHNTHRHIDKHTTDTQTNTHKYR